MSENILQQIQSELKAPKGQKNTFGNYNYRSCEDIMEALKPVLAPYNATVTLSDEVKEVQGVPLMIIVDESTKPKTKAQVTATLVYVEATATFTCGNEVVSVKASAGVDVNKAGMDIAQCFGSSSSYARKYALNGLFCIDDTKDDDNTATYQNQHENAGKANEKKKEGFKTALNSATSIEQVDSIMKEAEAAWCSWPDTWQNGLNKLAATRERALAK